MKSSKYHEEKPASSRPPDDIFAEKKSTTMAGTFSQVYIQLVFAVKGRQNLIDNPGKRICISIWPELLKEKIRNPL